MKRQKIVKPLSDYSETKEYFKLETSLRHLGMSSSTTFIQESFLKKLSQNCNLKKIDLLNLVESGQTPLAVLQGLICGQVL